MSSKGIFNFKGHAHSAGLAFLVAANIMIGTALAGPNDNTYYAKEGVALAGYDTVAYFTQGEAMEGNAQFAHEWRNLTWHFSTQEHRDLFAANPFEYAPQFGGFCAFGVTQVKAMTPDMTIWEIEDGLLYLYADPWAQETWGEDRDSNEDVAVGVWEQELITHRVE